MMDELIEAEIAKNEIRKMFQDKVDEIKSLKGKLEIQEDILDSVKAATRVLARERDKVKKELVRVEIEKLHKQREKMKLEDRVNELEMRIDVIIATEYVLEEVE